MRTQNVVAEQGLSLLARVHIIHFIGRAKDELGLDAR